MKKKGLVGAKDHEKKRVLWEQRLMKKKGLVEVKVDE